MRISTVDVIAGFQLYKRIISVITASSIIIKKEKENKCNELQISVEC